MRVPMTVTGQLPFQRPTLMRRRRLQAFAVAVLVGLSSAVSSTAWGGEAIPINVAPTAVRGGILAIPLRLPPEGDGLPAEVSLTIRDPASDQATQVLGRVIYLATPIERTEPRWTRSANPTVIRTVADGVDPRTLLQAELPQRIRSVDAALLLVDTPVVSGAATLQLGKTILTPAWLEPGPTLEAVGEASLMDPEGVAPWSDDRPDPQSPFEWFRWTLIAPLRGERVPAPPGDIAGQLFARHVAELWLAGLARIERQSKGVADSVRDWLTATVHWAGRDSSETFGHGKPLGPPGTGIAMWIADPAELGSLLGILLDRNRDDESIMNAVLAWMDARTPMALWVESDVAGRVTVVLANPLIEEMVVTMQWLGESLPPLATLVPFRTIDRVHVDRPAGRPSAGDSPEPIVLALESGSTVKRLAFAPRAVRAKPPSLSFGAFVPAMTLADVQAGRLGAVPPEWSTVASLRRRDGHWEVFAECMTPTPNSSSETAADSLTVVVRDHSFTVRRDGTIDGDADALVEVGVRNYADRWRVRITLPDSWLPRPGVTAAVLSMGLRRDTPVVQSTAVLARAAFTSETPVVEIDVSEWQEGIAQDVATPPAGSGMQDVR